MFISHKFIINAHTNRMSEWERHGAMEKDECTAQINARVCNVLWTRMPHPSSTPKESRKKRAAPFIGISLSAQFLAKIYSGMRTNYNTERENVTETREKKTAALNSKLNSNSHSGNKNGKRTDTAHRWERRERERESREKKYYENWYMR